MTGLCGSSLFVVAQVLRSVIEKGHGHVQTEHARIAAFLTPTSKFKVSEKARQLIMVSFLHRPFRLYILSSLFVSPRNDQTATPTECAMNVLMRSAAFERGICLQVETAILEGFHECLGMSIDAVMTQKAARRYDEEHQGA